jgi:TPR repeat protein
VATDQGLAIAQNNLGTMYEDGKVLPQDYKEAIKWYRLAANQGKALALINLGASYVQGRGVPSNRIIAYALFNLGAVESTDQSVKTRENRSHLSQLMSSKEIDSAQNLTKEMAKPNNLLTALDSFLRK